MQCNQIVPRDPASYVFVVSTRWLAELAEEGSQPQRGECRRFLLDRNGDRKDPGAIIVSKRRETFGQSARPREEVDGLELRLHRRNLFVMVLAQYQVGELSLGKIAWLMW